MSMRGKHITLVEPTPEETDWLLGYARRLIGVDPHPVHDQATRDRARERYQRWLEDGTWFSPSSCFEGGGCGPDTPWHEHNRQRIAVWRDSADKHSPEQVAFHAWCDRGGSFRDEPLPTQTWATLTWQKVRQLLIERERAAADPQLPLFDDLRAAA